MNVAVNSNDFNGLVNESLKTTSRIIAERFGKRHTNVLRDIRNLECSEEFSRLNFEPVEYLDAKGQSRTEYSVSRDGFTFLAMGFTGKEAAAWKERFIAAFNAMADHIRAQRQSATIDLSDPGQLVPLLTSYAQRTQIAEAKVIEFQPKAEALDRLEASEGSQLPSVVAKVLSMPQNRFFKELHAKNWIFKRGKVWVGYEDKVKRGYLENDTKTFIDANGEERTTVQLKITPKGMARLAQIFAKGGAA